MQGANPSDLIAFYAADIGETRHLSGSNISAALAEALDPGRWLIQVAQSIPGAQVWLCVGVFDPAVPLVATVGAGLDRIPMGPALQSVEFNVRRGHNDALAVVCSAGTADVWITNVSRRA